MIKINKHIEIVRSSYSWLSSMSQESHDTLKLVLMKNFKTVGTTIVNNPEDLDLIVIKNPDLVFLGMKFVPSDERLGLKDTKRIWVTDFLDDHEILYTGSSQSAHILELNKPLAKQRALDQGLSTSPFFVVGQDQATVRSDVELDFPLFVKPIDRGGGMGIDSTSVVRNFRELQSKVKSITVKLHSDSMVEKYLEGREFSVAVLKNEFTDEYETMPIELIVKPDDKGVSILSGKVKSSNSEQAVALNDKALKIEISNLALDIFIALGARDYGRIDIRLDQDGRPNFLEANLLPSLIEGYGSFPKACNLNLGLDYESMILGIVSLAFNRRPENQPELVTKEDSALAIFDTALVAKA
jgi:D-alanine-D-alanine ligase